MRVFASRTTKLNVLILVSFIVATLYRTDIHFIYLFIGMIVKHGNRFRLSFGRFFCVLYFQIFAMCVAFSMFKMLLFFVFVISIGFYASQINVHTECDYKNTANSVQVLLYLATFEEHEQKTTKKNSKNYKMKIDR